MSDQIKTLDPNSCPNCDGLMRQVEDQDSDGPFPNSITIYFVCDCGYESGKVIYKAEQA